MCVFMCLRVWVPMRVCAHLLLFSEVVTHLTVSADTSSLCKCSVFVCVCFVWCAINEHHLSLHDMVGPNQGQVAWPKVAMNGMCDQGQGVPMPWEEAR